MTLAPNACGHLAAWMLGMRRRLPARFRKAPLPALAALQRDWQTMPLGPLLSATEHTLVFGSLTVLLQRLDKVPDWHDG
jgi:hypothetical protein